MGRSSMCCSNWALSYLGKKKVFEANVRFDRRERCGWLVMSAVGKRWKSSGMNARYLPLLPDFYRVLISHLSVLTILFTVEGSICTVIYWSVCCVPENDEGGKYLPSRSSQYTGRKKLKKINKPTLFLSGQRIEHLILASGGWAWLCWESDTKWSVLLQKQQNWGRASSVRGPMDAVPWERTVWQEMKPGRSDGPGRAELHQSRQVWWLTSGTPWNCSDMYLKNWNGLFTWLVIKCWLFWAFLKPTTETKRWT